MNMIRQSLRGLATQAKTAGEASAVKFNIAQPPKYTLASLRSFPSLEPHNFIPLPTGFFDVPLRRDFLWSAVVFEADRARVGSGNVITRGDKPYSHKKLLPQKGTGRARQGDANSPSRYNEVKAHGIKAPHDWSTKLPFKIYSKAVATAFADQYRNGKLFVVGKIDSTSNIHDADDTIVDFKYPHEEATKQFVDAHDLHKLNLLFITDVQRDNLLQSTEVLAKKMDVIVKEELEVRDILKANRIYIELPALQWLIGKYGSD